MLGIEKVHNIPMVVSLTTSYIPTMLAKIASNAAFVDRNGYGRIYMVGLRYNGNLPALNATVGGAYGETVELVEEDIFL